MTKMTQKRPTSETLIDVSRQGKRLYETPSIVRYGGLFAETGKTACSDTHADNGHTDFCDPDGGPVDGSK